MVPTLVDGKTMLTHDLFIRRERDEREKRFVACVAIESHHERCQVEAVLKTSFLPPTSTHRGRDDACDVVLKRGDELDGVVYLRTKAKLEAAGVEAIGVGGHPRI